MYWKTILLCTTVFRLILCDFNCGDDESCPKYKPFCSKVGCVFECPPSFYINGTNCLSSCGDWYVKDRFCVQQCPDNWFERVLLTKNNGQQYMEKQCIEQCSTAEYMLANKCVHACPLNLRYINNRNCSSHCPLDKPLLRNFTINLLNYSECVNYCLFYVDGDYCTDKCGEKFVFNSTCVEKCPEAFPFVFEKKCVHSCPATTVYINQSTCQQNCSKETPFFVNGTCTKTCPDTFYITNRNGVIFCEESCHEGEYKYKNTCLKSCGFYGKRNYYLFYLNDTCQEKCPSHYKEQKYAYPYVGTCMEKCPKHYFVLNGSCVAKCPENTSLFNYTCVHNCPTNVPLTCKVGNDLKCTRDGLILNNNQLQLCLSTCPNGTYIFNKTCVAKCPLLYSVFGQVCMEKCPKQFPLTQNKGHSYTKCDGWNCWRMITETVIIPECVSECPKELIIFNSTCVLECPLTHNYVENRTCKSDGCSTTYHYNETSYIICTDSCDDEYFILNNTCVKECPDDAYITDKTCHFNECQSKYIYNTSNGIICTNDCTQYGLLNENVCTEHCPMFVFNDSCVDSCPKDHSLLTNQTSKVQIGHGSKVDMKLVSYVECRNSCSEYLFLHENLCLHTCPTSSYLFEQTCVSKCPPSKPFHQYMVVENNKTDEKGNEYFANFCVKSCNFPSSLYDVTRYTCVSVCPNETQYIYQNVCTKGCPKGKAALKIDQGVKCVDHCPSKTVLFNDTCLSSCPKKTYNFNDTMCVFECPKSMPLGLRSGNWRCIKHCESFETFKNGSCINEYDCKEPYFIFETSCILSCPDGYFWYKGCEKRWDTSDTTLVAVLLGVWVLLVFWSKTALKEYFIVLSMIFLKRDVRYIENEEESMSDVTEINDDRQPLITQDDEIVEI